MSGLAEEAVSRSCVGGGATGGAAGGDQTKFTCGGGEQTKFICGGGGGGGDGAGALKTVKVGCGTHMCIIAGIWYETE